NLREVISRESKENSFELIVMGTKGATGLRYALMGSNTFDVISKSHIPVLAVPEESIYKLQKVGVLSNYKNSEIDVLNDFIKIVGTKFSGVLLHVNEEADKSDQDYAQTWKEVVKEKTGIEDLDYKVGKGDKVRDIVNDMVDQEKV